MAKTIKEYKYNKYNEIYISNIDCQYVIYIKNNKPTE